MILLDTHVWLWWLHDSNRLSNRIQNSITEEESQNGILISTISVWEIAVKSSLGKLTLPLPRTLWMRSLVLNFQGNFTKIQQTEF